MLKVLSDIAVAAADVLLGASPWLVVSFVLAGLMHEYVRPERLQSALGNTRLSSIAKATVSGMLLPICSCGVVPLGLGLYYSGAYLGPVLAFMAATPIINPAAVLLAYGLLGPKIATIYLIAGFVIPMILGVVGNHFAGPELYRAGAVVASTPERHERLGVAERIKSGLHYGFTDLGLVVSKYVVIGAFFAGAVFALVPASFIDRVLGDPGMLSLGSVAVLAAAMYVCAVGHIPFVAALVAAGASPGIAITFLMAGAATNLPELISMNRLIGKRATIIFASVLVAAGIGVGYVTNLLLAGETGLLVDPSKGAGTKAVANWLIASVPPWLQWASAAVIVALAIASYRGKLATLFAKRAEEVAA